MKSNYENLHNLQLKHLLYIYEYTVLYNKHLQYIQFYIHTFTSRSAAIARRADEGEKYISMYVFRLMMLRVYSA